MNYVYGHKTWEFYETSTESSEYQLTRATSGKVNGQDITNRFLAIYNVIEGEKPGNAELVVSDVIVTDVSTDVVNIKVDRVYAVSPSVISSSYSSEANKHRQAGTDKECYTGATLANETYNYNQNLAFNAYKSSKYGGNVFSGFAANVERYGETGLPSSNQNIQHPINSGKLFGRPNSAVPAYNGGYLPDTTCLQENEQDKYIEAMNDKCFNYGSPYTFTVMAFNVNKTPSPLNNDKIVWYYNLIRVSDWVQHLDPADFTPAS